MRHINNKTFACRSSPGEKVVSEKRGSEPATPTSQTTRRHVMSLDPSATHAMDRASSSVERSVRFRVFALIKNIVNDYV